VTRAIVKRPEGWVRALRTALEAVASPERREKEKSYLKSELDHLGASVPAIRKLTRAALNEVALDHDTLWVIVHALWAEPVHELRAAAVEALDHRSKLLVAGDMAPLETLLRASRTWALLDPLAIHVVGGLVASAPPCTTELDRWASDEDFWMRRAALLALLKPLRNGAGDFDRFSRYADAMLEENEFFIRKAIGWVLRDTGRKRPALVSAWLEPRLHRASGVTVREAIKHLPNRDTWWKTYRAGGHAGGG
jgi:3-methyladenine DNA glycosylase AlkD